MIFCLRNIGAIATTIEHKGEMLIRINNLKNASKKVLVAGIELLIAYFNTL